MRWRERSEQTGCDPEQTRRVPARTRGRPRESGAAPRETGRRPLRPRSMPGKTRIPAVQSKRTPAQTLRDDPRKKVVTPFARQATLSLEGRNETAWRPRDAGIGFHPGIRRDLVLGPEAQKGNAK
jgi:hypothetical protein